VEEGRRERRRAPAREKDSRARNSPLWRVGPALKFDIDHLANPGAVNGAISQGGRPQGRREWAERRVRKNLSARVYNFAGKQFRMDRSIDRSLARETHESRNHVYIAAPRARYIDGTNEIRVRSPRSRARHWRAVAPGLLVRGATEQRRDARRHLVSLSLSLSPPSFWLGSGDVHPAVQHRGPHWTSRCPGRRCPR